jgi:hypothetical protein
MMMTRLSQRFPLRDILLVSFWTAVVQFLLIGWCASSVGIMIFAQLLTVLRLPLSVPRRLRHSRLVAWGHWFHVKPAAQILQKRFQFS